MYPAEEPDAHGGSIGAAAGIPLKLRLQPGYDHSYYFISTFMADHMRWHAERLG